MVNKFVQVTAIGAWVAGGEAEGAYLSVLDLIDNYFSHY